MKHSETLGSVPVLCNRTNGPAWYLAVGFALKCGRWREAHSFPFVSEWMETQGVLLKVFLFEDKFKGYKYAFTLTFFCKWIISNNCYRSFGKGEIIKGHLLPSFFLSLSYSFLFQKQRSFHFSWQTSMQHLMHFFLKYISFMTLKSCDKMYCLVT